MITALTPPIREVIEKAEKMLSFHFQTPLNIENVVQLSEPDRRNLILRLMVNSANEMIPQRFIVKKTTLELRGETEQEQMSRFARDWAGIEFLTSIGTHHAPRFYGGDRESQFIIIEDLGEPHYSLVGPLTRLPTPANVQEAINALAIYSRRLGQMHADTFGKTNEFTQILHRIYPHTLRLQSLKETNIAEVMACFKRHTGDDSFELRQELEAIQQVMSCGDFEVLLHGDICPDNVYFQQSDMQIIDFEYGDVGPALIDGVYLRMSMPSCWCAKVTPSHIVTQMETIYQNELKTKILLANNEAIYNKACVYACALWIIRVINWHVDEVMEQDSICPSGPVDQDSLWKPESNAFRPRILSRLAAFIDIAEKHQHLPALTQASSKLLKHLQQQWPTTHFMDYYPVFT
ncbi:phosphotransferase [Candidatus Berkiella aquae]|uniref:Aminoglycoside phosphotransferase family protein n=1 Tax=Candidatus Berkiella aquae TaxID=295108 RepID=A0A0Q9YX82_9GAMM|nr:phosphotransferase [Candidatus Berkiella aquae]MCS5711501.1 aminoglycoside phosphotransferase family protein [Candidatus Berkiella aquae]